MTAPTVVIEQPVLTHAPRRYVLYRHRVVAQRDLQPTLSDTFRELYACVGAAGVSPAGPPFVIYHAGSVPGVRWEIDICAPVATPLIAPPCFEYIEMPSCIVVSLLHVGPYETLGGAYDAIDEYIREHGVEPAGPPREFYYSDPSVPPSETRTLVERPVSQP
jgi:effector-binding domain-containing protein